MPFLDEKIDINPDFTTLFFRADFLRNKTHWENEEMSAILPSWCCQQCITSYLHIQHIQLERLL